ncbi:MAG: N-6 DNA methylase [Planctomycetota bacterium]
MKPADQPVSTAARDRKQRKRQGVFYTPAAIAQYLAASTLAVSQSSGKKLDELRVVDPACGEGALLWAAYHWLCQHGSAKDGAARFEVLRRQLFGVDLDSQSIENLRQAFRADLGDLIPATQLEPVLASNFRSGNAVLGDAWKVSAGAQTTAFHWHREFHEIRAVGGFDVVLANPPYRRERGAKVDLAELENAPLADRWRQSRMDLWHYFFHRSLDLLRPDGLLNFIVNSYWTTSRAGQPLIARLVEETSPLEFVILETAPVFAGVVGRHLIMQLRKGVTSELCDVLTLRESAYPTAADPNLWAELLQQKNSPAAWPETSSFTRRQIPRDELFQEGQIKLGPREVPHQRRDARLSPSSGTLGELFEVRQGIAENPPRVTLQQAREQPKYCSGEGVFVLTTDELRQLNLSEVEARCVRPYYSAVEVSRYWSPAEPTQWLLYLTRDTASDLVELPHIAEHLGRFRPILERRRETQQGKIPWWYLHWPRESRLFERPRILAVQMVREPKFAWVESPTYVGFSVNLIVERVNSPSESTSPRLTLPALTAVLNSRWARDWFQRHAKRRGVNLDITGSVLKSFPIPELAPGVMETLSRLSLARCELERQTPSPEQTSQIAEIEAEIDELVAAALID